MRILIVDDNKSIRNLIKQCIQSVATEIMECSNGSEVLPVYKSFQPDWVLMDIEMPFLDGLTVTRELKQYYPGANVIIISQYDTPEYRIEAEATGVLKYLHKDNISELPLFISGEEIKPEKDEKQIKS